jgi:hypothetical protein
MQNITINNNATLDGTASSGFNAFVTNLPGVPISGSFQRYRLVSCLIKVTITNTVLNMGGKMYSCATYDPFSIKYYSALSQNDTLVDRFGNFSIVRNGLWNTTVNVNETNCIEALWVPTDGYDYFFQRQYAYYGTAYSAVDTLMTPSTDGAHIGYIFALNSLPANSTFVVEQWANYEMIPDPTAASYLGASVDTAWTSQAKDRYTDVMKAEIKENGLIRIPQKQSESWGNILKNIVSTGLPYLLKMLSL